MQIVDAFFKRFIRTKVVDPATFKLSEMVKESGSYQHALGDYQIVPLRGDASVTDKLPAQQARACYAIYQDEMSARAERFSDFLGMQGMDLSLGSLENWVRMTAELSRESTEMSLRPVPFRPRLRAMHFDASCLAHQLAMQGGTLSSGFAGDFPLFQGAQNIDVFPIVWVEKNPNVFQNLHKLVKEAAAGALLGVDDPILVKKIAQLDSAPVTPGPVEELRLWWEVEFLKENGRAPNHNDLLEMVNELKLRPDDIPPDILEASSNSRL